MLGQGRRRSASIETTLAACDCPAVCVFACTVSLSQRHVHIVRWTNYQYNGYHSFCGYPGISTPGIRYNLKTPFAIKVYINLYSKTCPYQNALGTNFYSGLDRFRFGEGFCFREEQTTITCTIGMRFQFRMCRR